MTAHALISTTCVNDCVFCAVSDKRSRGHFPRPEEISEFIVSHFKRGENSIVFSGLGEPTLDPNLEAYIALATQVGYEEIGLFTNGFRLTQTKVQRWRGLGLTRVLISFHGLSEGHDASVGREGSFREAVHALKLYTEGGLTVSVNTCITKYNLHEIPMLCQLLDTYNLSEHTISFPEWDGNVLNNKNIMPTYKDLVQCAEALAAYCSPTRRISNAPACLVKVPINRSVSIGYLDGGGERTLDAKGNNILPLECIQSSCSNKQDCPGFDQNYVEFHGWDEILEVLKPRIHEMEIRNFLQHVASHKG